MESCCCCYITWELGEGFNTPQATTDQNKEAKSVWRRGFARQPPCAALGCRRPSKPACLVDYGCDSCHAEASLLIGGLLDPCGHHGGFWQRLPSKVAKAAVLALVLEQLPLCKQSEFIWPSPAGGHSPQCAARLPERSERKISTGAFRARRSRSQAQQPSSLCL